MKLVTIDFVLSNDYLQKFSTVINGQDDYWIEQNDFLGVPEGIQKLKKAIGVSNCSLSTLVKEAKQRSTSMLMHKPDPCLKGLYQMLLDVAQGKFEQVTQALSGLTKAQQQYVKLKNDLQTNEIMLKQAESANDKAKQAEIYKNRGLLYWDADNIRYARHACGCFSQAIALNANPLVTAFCLRKRAGWYLTQAQTNEGINDLNEACKRVNDNPEAWLEYGEALITVEQYEKAVEVLKKSLILRPDHSRTQGLLKEAMMQGKLPANDLQNIEILLAVGQTFEGLNARAQERSGLPLWLQMVQLGDRVMVAYLAPQVDTQIRDKAGNTALHYAARFGHAPLIKLLNQTIDLNTLNEEGITPLLVAIKEGKVTMAEALIEAGAHSTNALLMAVQTGQGCVFEALYPLLGQGSDHALLLRKSIETKQLPMLKMLLHYYPDALNTLYQDETLLHYAMRVQFTAGVHYLIDIGIDLSIGCGPKTTEEVAIECASNYPVAIQNAKAKQQRLQKQRADLEHTFLQNLQAHFPLLKDADNQVDFLKALNEVLAGAMIKDDLMCYFVKHLIQHKVEITVSRKFVTDKFKIDALKDVFYKLMDSWLQSLVVPEHSVQPNNGLSQVSIVFCERFEKQLDEAYGYFRAVASGELTSVKDQQLMQQGQNLTKLLPNITVQGLTFSTSLLASGVLEFAGYLRQNYCRKQAERMTHIFQGVTPYERTHFIRYTAEQLMDKYQAQIHHLMPSSEGVELFADCAAARVIEYITSSDQHRIAHDPSAISNLVRSVKSWMTGKAIPPEQQVQKDLYQLFIDGIVRVSSEFPKDKERLKTINHLTATDNWNSKGIFENTGILTPDQQRFAHPNVNIDQYGYCKGTVDEARHRDLTLGPKKGVYWGQGRIWEATEEIQHLEPLSGRAVLPAYKKSVQLHLHRPSTERKNEGKPEVIR